MNVIDNSQIQTMLAQLRAIGGQAAAPGNAVTAANDKLTGGVNKTETTEKPDFAAALKATLDNVNNIQNHAEALGEQFIAGDDNVQLSDVMISMQKASIALQTTVQARNRLVSAYQEIMGMQI